MSRAKVGTAPQGVSARSLPHGVKGQVNETSGAVSEDYVREQGLKEGVCARAAVIYFARKDGAVRSSLDVRVVHR